MARHSRTMKPTYRPSVVSELTPLTAGMSDDLLLQAFATRGDRPALNAFLERHADFSWQVARRALGNASDADDAVQSAFVQVLTHAGTYARGGNARGWLATIVLNECRQLLRARQRRHRRQGFSLTGLMNPASAPEPEDDPQLLARLRSALAQIPLRFRLPFEMHVVEGLPHAEVAQLLSIAEGTARSRTSRTLTRLRTILGRDESGTLAALALWKLDREAPPADLLMRAMPQTPAPPAAATWSLRLVTAGCVVATVLACALVVGHDRYVHRTGPPAAPPLPLRASSPCVPVAVDPFDIRIQVRLWHDDLPSTLTRLSRALPPRSPITFACGPGLLTENLLALMPWAGVTVAGDRPTSMRSLLDTSTRQLGLIWRPSGAVAVISRPVPRDTLPSVVAGLRADDAVGLGRIPESARFIDDLATLPTLLDAAFALPAPGTAALRTVFGSVELSAPDPLEAAADPRQVGAFAAVAADGPLIARARQIIAEHGTGLRTVLAIDVVAAAHDRGARDDLVVLLAQPQTRDHAAAALAGIATPADLPILSAQVRTVLAGIQHDAAGGNRDSVLVWMGGAIPSTRASVQELPPPELSSCIQALIAIGGPEAVTTLCAIAGSPTLYPGARMLALQGLKQLPQGHAALEVFRTDADPLVAQDSASLCRELASDAAIAAADPSTIGRLRVAALLDAERALPASSVAEGMPDAVPHGLISVLTADPGSLASLVMALTDAEPRVRSVAAQAVAEVREPSGVDALIAADHQGVREAQDALKRCHDPRAEAALIVDLTLPTATVADSTALLSSWAPHDAPTLAALVRYSHDQADPQERLGALADLPTQDAVAESARLQAAVTDPDPQVRGMLLGSLVPMTGEPSPAIKQILLRACTDPHRYVRACALVAAAGSGAAWSRAQALHTLSADPDEQVRAYAVAVLNANADAVSLSSVLAALAADPAARVRRAAAARLAQSYLTALRIGQPDDPRAATMHAALLTAMTHDPDPTVRAAVQRGLASERDEWLRPPLWQDDGLGDLGGPG